MTFGHPDLLLLSHQHQQALNRHAAEFRRLKPAPRVGNPLPTRPPRAPAPVG